MGALAAAASAEEVGLMLSDIPVLLPVAGVLDPPVPVELWLAAEWVPADALERSGDALLAQVRVCSGGALLTCWVDRKHLRAPLFV